MQKTIENNVFMCLVKSIDYICLHNQLHPLGNVAEICYTVEGVNTVSNVYETAIVEKRNILNELRSNNMTLQELRFFSIYHLSVKNQSMGCIHKSRAVSAVRFSADSWNRAHEYAAHSCPD